MRFFTKAIMAIMASMAITSSVSANFDETIPVVPQVLKITNLLRTLDLTKPVIREITSSALQNIAEESVSEYFFPIDSGYEENLALITAENRKTKESLSITRDPDYDDG
jgi:oligosaccharyltransferase complex subunit alpha (ribophorin I)